MKKKVKHDPLYYKRPEHKPAVIKKCIEIASFIAMRGPMSKTDIRKRLGGGSSIFSEAFRNLEKHNKAAVVNGKFTLTNYNKENLCKSFSRMVNGTL